MSSQRQSYKICYSDVESIRNEKHLMII